MQRLKMNLVAASVSAAVGNEYTVSAGLSKSTAADVIASLTDGATVTAAGVSNGFAAGATGNAYKFNQANNTFTYNTTSTAAELQSYLTPKAGDTATSQLKLVAQSRMLFWLVMAKSQQKTGLNFILTPLGI